MKVNSQHRLLLSAPRLLILGVLLLLAACGVTTSVAGNGQASLASSTAGSVSATPSGHGTVIPFHTPTVTITKTGCPLPTQTVNWPSPPTIVVTAAEAAKGTSLQVGQTLELELPFGRLWMLGPSSTWKGILTLESPAGYGDASLKSCIWRFTAQKRGQAAITFTFAPVCKPPMECPQFVGVLNVVVAVN
jgi:hypothetical protein